MNDDVASPGARPQRILIVEDEAELLDEVASFLRRRGETVLTATTFAEAASILRDDPVDVLVTDSKLADGNGVDLIHLQRELRPDSSICFLMTGQLERSESSAGLDDVKIFYKPFAASALYRELKAAFA